MLIGQKQIYNPGQWKGAGPLSFEKIKKIYVYPIIKPLSAWDFQSLVLVMA